MLLQTNNTARYQNNRTPRNYTTLLTGLPNSALSEDHHLERFLTWAQTDFTERRFGWGGCRHILVMMVRLLLVGQDPLEHGDAGLLLSSRHITLCSHLLHCNRYHRQNPCFEIQPSCWIIYLAECFHSYRATLGCKPHRSISHPNIFP